MSIASRNLSLVQAVSLQGFLTEPSLPLCSVKSFNIRDVRIYSVWLHLSTHILTPPIQPTCTLVCFYTHHHHHMHIKTDTFSLV